MSETDLGKALLKGEESIDLHALTRGVIRRDRRRVWVLSAVCMLSWIAVVMLPWGTILPALAKITEFATASNGSGGTNHSQRDLLLLLQMTRKGVMATFALSLVTTFTAGLCTVLLITISRRATLRQLNARMAEISIQLKVLAEKGK